MLTELSIKKFAIIDDLTISFSDGLTVLTGETGAGKSIIINAVNLILGSRVSGRMIRTGSSSAEIEALFTIEPGSRVAADMEANGYDASEGLLIRRIISETGRHKIYINGRLATIQILSSITENLASISGQHAHQGLLNEELHLDYLDQFGGLMPLRRKVREAYTVFVPLKNRLNRLVTSQKRDTEQLELYTFQKKEIEDADIQESEDIALEDEKKRLEHSEQLFGLSQRGLNDLYEGDGSVYERLNSLAGDLDRAVAIDGDLESIAGELADAVYRVEDLAARFREYGAGITMDENRLEEIIERLDLLIKLKRKYGGANGTLGDVISAYQSICRKLEAVNTVDDEIESLNLLVDKAFSELKTLVCDLSAQRKKIAGDFAAKVENELTGLEMKGTRFAVELSSVPLSSAEDKMLAIDDLGGVTDTGCDQATFLIAPNVGEALRPLVKIASGGELSRVILALKAILVRVDSLGTVVFDEVDTGVGGSIAEVVGKKIAQLSRYHQVICITHLPQIAKFGRHHYKIEKHVVNDRTATTIFPLGEGERIAEIARMLGGVEITRATLDHAREMMDAT